MLSWILVVLTGSEIADALRKHLQVNEWRHNYELVQKEIFRCVRRIWKKPGNDQELVWSASTSFQMSMTVLYLGRRSCLCSDQPHLQKNIYFYFIDYAKAFDCVDHKKLENSESDGNTRPPNLPLEKSVCRSGSNSQNWTWSNRLVPNRKRSTSRLYIVTLLI